MLKEKNAVDYGDLILKVIQLFREYPDILKKYQDMFKFVLVDEVQDLNKIQQVWLEYILGDKPKRLTCVGDDDQMIYGFRRADGEFILKFEEIYPNAKIIKLEQNYRSTKEIVKAANNLISHNINRKGK